MSWEPKTEMFTQAKGLCSYQPSHQGKVGNRARTFVSKGWGWEDWIWNNESYCGKLLFVKQGRMCSWHYHNLKDETFYLQSGELEIITGWSDDLSSSMIEPLRPGEAYHIPRGLRHRFRAVQDSYMFEFSTQHFDSDSIRVMPGD